ncbi:MAG: response regulator [Gammaproteobacteria bacterium]
MKVLLTDDDPDHIALVQALLDKVDGCETQCFTVSADSLTWCETNVPDLVIVDYMMPEVDGMEFIRRFRGMAGKEVIPVIMVTSRNEVDVRHQALNIGATDFLTKPVDAIELSARVRNMLTIRRNQKQLANRAVWLAGEVEKATAGIVARERETIVRLSKAAEYRDPETGAHIIRMSHYARLIARSIGLSEEEQDLIQKAAPMHDIGKVGIPDNILLKPGRLEPDELKIMRQHAQIGHEILKDSDSPILRVAAQIALTHHERYDGTGYPHATKGDDIPIVGRITALADVFDALLSCRPYKKAWEMDRVLELINNETGKHFDPLCVDALFEDWDAVLEVGQRFRDDFPIV